MIIAMNRQGVPAVGEAPLPQYQSGKGFPSHSVAPYTFADLWVIVSLSKEGDGYSRDSEIAPTVI